MKGDEKLVKKFLTDRMHITVEDCDRLLTAYGYEWRKGGGSHRTYHKKGTRPITVVVPKNTKYVNTSYAKNIIKVLELEG
ncbi:MAG: type II toxin-antitoxin system HicA family toxin [Chloroflexi bacterium]|nr:type II toxin-antitoxin system HicA family toxin [Chloroflexota bacterium]